MIKLKNNPARRPGAIVEISAIAVSEAGRSVAIGRINGVKPAASIMGKNGNGVLRVLEIIMQRGFVAHARPA